MRGKRNVSVLTLCMTLICAMLMQSCASTHPVATELKPSTSSTNFTKNPISYDGDSLFLLSSDEYYMCESALVDCGVTNAMLRMCQNTPRTCENAPESTFWESPIFWYSLGVISGVVAILGAGYALGRIK